MLCNVYHQFFYLSCHQCQQSNMFLTSCGSQCYGYLHAVLSKLRMVQCFTYLSSYLYLDMILLVNKTFPLFEIYFKKRYNISLMKTSSNVSLSIYLAGLEISLHPMQSFPIPKTHYMYRTSGQVNCANVLINQSINQTV